MAWWKLRSVVERSREFPYRIREFRKPSYLRGRHELFIKDGGRKLFHYVQSEPMNLRHHLRRLLASWKGTPEPYSPKLEMWYLEAYQEAGMKKRLGEIDKRYALYPKRFYKTVQGFDQNKTIDFCFIGAFRIDAATVARRSWIVPFIEHHFTDKSYLQFTDQSTKSNHTTLGVYDYTLLRNGFVPKETAVELRNYFDERYFRTMCSSQFTLCPGGDENWSMRFYEALMCKTIPILLDRTSFRSTCEARLPYKYFLVGERMEYISDWAEQNYETFLKYHTLEYFERP